MATLNRAILLKNCQNTAHILKDDMKVLWQMQKMFSVGHSNPVLLSR